MVKPCHAIICHDIVLYVKYMMIRFEKIKGSWVPDIIVTYVSCQRFASAIVSTEGATTDNSENAITLIMQADKTPGIMSM